jgi:hypothetical protein
LSSILSKEILHSFSTLEDNHGNNDLMTAELLLWVYMSEQVHSESRHFYPYLHTLSKQPPSPHYWSEQLLHCLTGTNLEILNGSQRILHEQSALLLSLIPHMSADSSKHKNALNDIFSYESLSWARGHYLSRG